MTLSVEEARERVLAKCRILEAETTPILESLGRVLAEDVRSDIDIAPFDNSAMDGFAVRAESVVGASVDSPVTLQVVSYIAAGSYSHREVGPGEAARIMTGAPMPPGADSVVMIEHTEPGEGQAMTGGSVRVMRPATAGDHIRRRGEDVRRGEVVLGRGELIGAPAIGLLASTGHAQVLVHRRPRVAVLSTGDELVEVDEQPGPGQIRNSNSYSVSAQVMEAGGLPLRYPIVRDDPKATRQAFEGAAAEADFIVTSGGVSAGDLDFVRPVLEDLGKLEFFKVCMRPGNPQTMGEIGGVPFFGLPGNPTSTFVGFEIFLRPALLKMQGHSQLFRPVQTAVLEHDVKKKPDRRYYLRGRVRRADDGRLLASLTGSQSSALLSPAHRASCLLVLPEGESVFAEGTVVQVLRLDMQEGTP